MKITFNAPFTLVFTILAVIVFILFQHIESPPMPFVLPGEFMVKEPVWYVSLVGYTLGHANLEHLLGNFSIILMLGPILEEVYGTKKLFIMVTITGISTAIFHMLFWDYGLMGASGIVFMFIVLSSLINIKDKELPLTFILVVILFLGKEIYNSFGSDSVSQFAHIAGGVTGVVFGYFHKKLGR
jgi:membrane associated rhomboid family serine protease